jgi:hypothetical protein
MIEICLKMFQRHEDDLDWRLYERLLWVCYFYCLILIKELTEKSHNKFSMFIME